MSFTAPYIYWCTWTYGDLHTVHPHAECVDVRHRMQGWRKQCKVQNMPLIWRMSYHATNSSYVTDHFLSNLLSSPYMCCIACCWKSLLYWKAPAACCRDRMPPLRAVPSFGPDTQRVSGPNARHVGPFFMMHLYIAVVCKWQPTVLSYGEALADCIVLRYFVWYCIVSIVFSYGCIMPSLLSASYTGFYYM